MYKIMTRKELRKRFNHKFKNISIYDITQQDKCFYCGETMHCYDHSPPLAFLGNMNGLYRGEYLLVPSCRSCNGLLGDAGTLTLEERVALAKHKIYKKNNKTIIIGERWSSEELNDFDWNSSLFPDIVKIKYASMVAIDRLLFYPPSFYIGGDKNNILAVDVDLSKYTYLDEIHTIEEKEALEKIFRKCYKKGVFV